MSSRTFICWDCKTSYRADVYSETTCKRCGKCGRIINFVSEKVEIPRKDDVEG